MKITNLKVTTLANPIAQHRNGQQLSPIMRQFKRLTPMEFSLIFKKYTSEDPKKLLMSNIESMLLWDARKVRVNTPAYMRRGNDTEIVYFSFDLHR